MTRRKSKLRKSKIVKIGKRASAIPTWVAAKTRGVVRWPRRRRQWRRSKARL